VRKNGDQASIIVVANKVDCTVRIVFTTLFVIPLQPFEVTLEEGEKFAKENNCLFIDCSAKTGHHVDEIFEKLAADILQKHTNSSK
jgi:GTPase SAR1 family protein